MACKKKKKKMSKILPFSFSFWVSRVSFYVSIRLQLGENWVYMMQAGEAYKGDQP